MDAFIIPAWIWLNLGVLIVAAAYIGLRLSRRAKMTVARAPAARAPYAPPVTTAG
jgi:type VI protein secretion system component VasF